MSLQVAHSLLQVKIMILSRRCRIHHRSNGQDRQRITEGRIKRRMIEGQEKIESGEEERGENRNT